METAARDAQREAGMGHGRAALIGTVLWAFPNKQQGFLLLRDPPVPPQLPEPGGTWVSMAVKAVSGSRELFPAGNESLESGRRR